jgi:CRISPR-associated endonuclease/helicase Cas3
MIETATEPVIIPYDEEGRRLLMELAKAKRPGRLARKLQPYIVNVPRSAFERLRAIGKVKAVQEDRFEDEFMALTEQARNELYSEDVGFDWRDPTFQKVESLVA